MFIKKISIALFCVTYALAYNKFIDEYNDGRAEIFKLTDNTVPTIRIQLPDDEYEQLKYEGSLNELPEKKFKDSITKQKRQQQQQQEEKRIPVKCQLLKQANSLEEQFLIEKYFAGNITTYLRHGEEPQVEINGKKSSNFLSVNEEDFLKTPIARNQVDSFKTKNASMVVELKKEKLTFEKVTLKLGGYSSRLFAKQGYNIKIRGGDELYGRTQFKIRPESRDATFLRSKLACDIHNRLNLPSISANYAQLYINGDYMGFYVFMDNIKLSWIDYEYGDEDTSYLYKCKEFQNYLHFNWSSLNCTNENEDLELQSNLALADWFKFLDQLDRAKTVKEVERMFNVKNFLYEMALEYLFGSWDHFLKYGHNFNMYKPPNGKWQMMLYDFDAEFGQDVNMVFPDPTRELVKDANIYTTTYKDCFQYVNKEVFDYNFAEFAEHPVYYEQVNRHILNVLIYNNYPQFIEVLSDVVEKAFNPATLFGYIDQLKDFIRPYVELDKLPDKNGEYPGRLNKQKGDYSINQWDSNCEFTTINTTQGFQAYGLKYWILMKYRYVCQTYRLKCDENYINKEFKYVVDKDVEASHYSLHPDYPPEVPKHPGQFLDTIVSNKPSTTVPEVTSTTTTTIVTEAEVTNNTTIPDVYTTIDETDSTTTIVDVPEVVTSTVVEPTVVEPTVVEPTVVEPTVVEPTVVEPTAEPTVIEPIDEPVVCVLCIGCIDCDAHPEAAIHCPQTCMKKEPEQDIPNPVITFTETELIPEPTTVNEPSTNYNCWAEYIGGYDCCRPYFPVTLTDENGEWGFNFKTGEWCGITPYIDTSKAGPCWSKSLGYSCCKGCTVYEVDADGSWGYEDDEWCGVQSYCPLNI